MRERIVGKTGLWGWGGVDMIFKIYIYIVNGKPLNYTGRIGGLCMGNGLLGRKRETSL